MMNFRQISEINKSDDDDYDDGYMKAQNAERKCIYIEIS